METYRAFFVTAFRQSRWSLRSDSVSVRSLRHRYGRFRSISLPLGAISIDVSEDDVFESLLAYRSEEAAACGSRAAED